MNDSFRYQGEVGSTCPFCHSVGGYLYRGLGDRLFGVAGEWNICRCNSGDCGALWLDPLPPAEELPRFYECYYTHQTPPAQRNDSARRLYRKIESGYLARRFGYRSAQVGRFAKLLGLLLYLHAGRRNEIDASVMNLAARPGGTLLEVGFGAGGTLERLRELGWNVQGIEEDPRAVEGARRRGLQVQLGDCAKLRFPADSFDAVVSSHVLEHLPDPVAFIREARRVLRPAGYFVARLPNVASLGHRIFRADWIGLDPPRHLHGFTPRLLNRLLRDNGFQVDRCGSSGSGAGLLLDSLMLWRKRHVQSYPFHRTWIALEMARVIEAAICAISDRLGEELLVIARKEHAP